MFKFPTYQEELVDLNDFLKTAKYGDYMDMIPYLKDVQSGDKLWDIHFGWSTVKDIDHSNKKFKLFYSDGNFNYASFYGFMNDGYGQCVFFEPFKLPKKLDHNSLCKIKIPKSAYSRKFNQPSVV